MHTPLTVFLDRDGVINRKAATGAYVTHWDDFVFLPGAKEALASLARTGRRLIVVTNQRGVARRLMTEATLTEIHERMVAELAAAGTRIAAVFACMHEQGACACHKPDIGLFLAARERFPDIDFARSAMIGDSLSDLEAAARLDGCRGYLVAADVEQRAAVLAEAARRTIPVAGVAPSLFEVARLVLGC